MKKVVLNFKELLEKQGVELDLKLIAGMEGLQREVVTEQVESPGLALAGYLKGRSSKTILVFGIMEVEYLKELEPELRLHRLQELLSEHVSAIILSDALRPLKELVMLSQQLAIPLLTTSMTTHLLTKRLTSYLNDCFAPTLSCHGTLVEIFDVGILLQGESGIGKSEAALGLVGRGHRLVADDVVKIKRLEGNRITGFSLDVSKHYVEIREIGLIDIANLYGSVSVCEKKNIDIVVKLEVWNDSAAYDRAGLDEKTTPILGLELPYQILPLKPGRDAVLLLETIALNHRLKKGGYHPAQQFEKRLVALISNKNLSQK